MEVQERRRLEAVMADLAAGDIAALWVLVNEFNAELRSVARGRLLAIGRHDLANDEDLLAGLVLDIGFLFIGTSWAADGGALPWVWARPAINQIVSDTAGHRAISFDAENVRSDVPAEPLIGADDVGLEHLAEKRPIVRLLTDAIGEVASDRDQQVHIAYRMQHADGDPSPANTVASEFGLAPANVRQIDKRTRAKLARLASTDANYAPLEELAWLA